MKLKSFTISLCILTTLLSLPSCNLPSAEQDSFQTRVAGTVAADNDAKPPADPQDAQPPAPEIPLPTLTATLNPTFTPTITASPSITLTSTLDAPMVSVSTNTNCRTGPSTIYDIVGALVVGEQAEVVGKGEWGNYWIIKNPDGAGECWLWSNYATVTGPTDGLTVYSPPPTPTPAFVWAGTWVVSIGSAEGGMYHEYVMTVTTDGREFTASVDMGGELISYTGTISDDYMSVIGTWMEDPEETGPFKFYALATNQFNGNQIDADYTMGICGTWDSLGFPVPCYVP